MHQRAPLSALAALLLLGVACTQPADPSSDDEYVSECPPSGCPMGFTCDEEVGRCVELSNADCVDADEDGYGEMCALGIDCNDADYFTNPSVDEICDGLDNDCDFIVDEEGICDSCESECTPNASECVGDVAYRECREVNGCSRWLPLTQCEPGQDCVDGACGLPCDDFDGDGYGDNCEAGLDCDDRNPFSFPGNREICDGYDNDCVAGIDDGGVCDVMCPPAPCAQGERRCDGAGAFSVCAGNNEGCLDWGPPITCRGDLVCESGTCSTPLTCEDNDGDGFGNGAGCDVQDCDDNDLQVNPDADERCNSLDDNCDGRTDENLSCASDFCATSHESVSTAIALQPQRAEGGYTCSNRETLWSIGSLSAGTPIVAAVTHAGAGRLVATLYLDNGGALVAKDTQQGPMVGLSSTLDTGGAYYLGVRSLSGESVPYLVSFANQSALSCDEGGEPNNSPSTAAAVPTHGHLAAAACTNDLDFYQVPSFNVPYIVAASVGFVSPGREPLLEMWRGGSNITPDQRLRAGVRVSHVRVDANEIVQAHLRGGNGERYDLGLAAWPAETCMDLGSPNDDGDDSIQTARALDNGRATGLLCAGDIDVYSLGQLNSGSSVDIEITFEAANVNLDAYLFRDSLDGFVQRAATDTSPERLPTGISVTGNYYVVIFGRSAADRGAYTRSVAR